MTRVHITGGWYSSRNAGDQAILISIHELLKERIPDLVVGVICANDDFVRREHQIDAVSHTKHLGKVLRAVAGSDALLIGGGTPFYDDFKHMCFFWILGLLTKVSGGKLIVYGASAQKLERMSTRWFTRRILNLADLVTVREPLTKTRFEALGVRNAIQDTADPAITLRPCSEARVDEILEREGLADPDRPLFAICPHFFSNTDPYRVHHYERFPDDCIERQKRVLAQMADYLSQIGRPVFVPMNTDPPDSDVEVQREIAERTVQRDRIRFIETQYRPREVAGILSRCKLVIGVRLHSLILAAAVRTPVLGISYAPKVAGFMQLIDEADHAFPLQTLEFPNLRDAIDQYLRDYDRRRERFAQHVAAVQQRAARNADLVADLLKPERGAR